MIGWNQGVGTPRRRRESPPQRPGTAAGTRRGLGLRPSRRRPPGSRLRSRLSGPARCPPRRRRGVPVPRFAPITTGFPASDGYRVGPPQAAALNLPRPHRRATLPVLGKNRPRCRVLPGVGGSLNGGAPGSTGNSAVRWLRAGLPPVNWQSTCQRQLRTRGLIDRDVPGHGPIHGRAWGDAKVDRTTGFARYLVGIVETELAPAGWMAFLLTRGGDDSKRRLRA